MTAFHEIRFPLDISLQSSGGPQRRTDIVTLGSNREVRNARWANSRRKFEAGYGVKTFDALSKVLSFFEERRGHLYGFRWRDQLEYKSCAPSQTVSPLDQAIGTGDGATSLFQLTKIYGQSFNPYLRIIYKPVDGTVRVAVNGVEKIRGTDFTCDAATGLVSFMSPPVAGAAITAGFMFDVPVRFETDFLDVDYSTFQAGQIPKIPIIEIVP